MKLHEIREIDRPQAEVFAYTADFSNIDQWDPGVKASRKIGDDPVGVGTKYELDVQFGSSVIPMTYEITHYEPDSRVVILGEGENLTALDEIRFSETPSGTLVDYTADLEFKNWIRYVIPLMSPVMKRVGTKALDGLVAAFAK